MGTVLLLCPFILAFKPVKAQDAFDKYLDYKRWSIHLNNVMYAPAYAQKLEGVYDIDPKPMRGTNFGIRFNFRREKQLSYYTALDIDFIPFYYFYYEVPPKEFPEHIPVIGRDYRKNINSHSVLTVPIGINWQKSISERKNNNLFFSISGDIRFHFIQPGIMSLSVFRGIGTNAVNYFYIYAESKPINILSPTINLAGGLEWFTKFAKIEVNLNFQKGTVPYLSGGYYYYNLLESPNTTGAYRVRADYIGIDIGIAPKKWRKK